MKSALLMLDVQKGFVQAGSFDTEINHITDIAEYFKQRKWPIYATKHFDSSSSSYIPAGTDLAEIDPRVVAYTNEILLKDQPSVFKNQLLEEWLQKEAITDLVIVGFNVEFCCLFNAIIAQEKGYSVTFIEDASATVNTETTYDMPGLDIRDFIATILHWSGTVSVMDTEEFIEK
ncbi:cysteine hydrolase family protein [Alkalicoccobacillus porphyridii]|uniref:Cysteine hydrolase n=1 Tax=Alkalicoccobacillus porphyridii TaxID=2597270 RepID=A0A554A3K1_9BACI|nr:isochorismatase family cysteine hydrolase [Alkalicoccobacillus porphyridii]TSB48271.1 cysteine hydrolase [Alkalicoccobacillus porphyridii]